MRHQHMWRRTLLLAALLAAAQSALAHSEYAAAHPQVNLDVEFDFTVANSASNTNINNATTVPRVVRAQAGRRTALAAGAAVDARVTGACVPDSVHQDVRQIGGACRIRCQREADYGRVTLISSAWLSGPPSLAQTRCHYVSDAGLASPCEAYAVALCSVPDADDGAGGGSDDGGASGGSAWEEDWEWEDSAAAWQPSQGAAAAQGAGAVPPGAGTGSTVAAAAAASSAAEGEAAAAASDEAAAPEQDMLLLGSDGTSSNGIADGSCIQTSASASACITSTSGRFNCCLRRDGIAALFDGPVRDAAYWAAFPPKNQTLARPLRLCMQNNGQVAGIDAGGAVFWSTPAPAAGPGGGPYTLYMQNDGNLVAYNRSCLPVWSAGKIRNPLQRPAPCAAQPDVVVPAKGGSLAPAPGYGRTCPSGHYVTAMAGWCRVTGEYDVVRGTPVHNMTGLGALACSDGSTLPLVGAQGPDFWQYGADSSGFSGVHFDAAAVVRRNGPCLRAAGGGLCAVYCGDVGTALDVKQQCPEGLVVAGLFGNATSSFIVSIGLVCRQLTL